MLPARVSMNKPAWPRKVARIPRGYRSGYHWRPIPSNPHQWSVFMAGDVSFDVVSDFDEQELRNALDQVRREVQQRFDFKGAKVDLEQEKTELVLLTDDDFRATVVK